ALEEKIKETGLELLQNRPNPFDEATYIGINASAELSNKIATIRIIDMTGKEVEKLEIELKAGMNEILYEHGYGKTGSYIYTLELDGNLIDSKRMIFSN
ncbi:MAG: T9SS type A sorting domain-containing protein, partial [Bacteroidetes bacterium]|nr:T9SS type A sorting domain-containing protein [Bacteroidota bacterium]